MYLCDYSDVCRVALTAVLHVVRAAHELHNLILSFAHLNLHATVQPKQRRCQRCDKESAEESHCSNAHEVALSANGRSL